MYSAAFRRGLASLICVICCFFPCGARLVDRALLLKQPLFSEQVGLWDGIRYTLHGLQPEAQYEVRVSYPATVRFCAPRKHIIFCRSLSICGKRPYRFQCSFTFHGIPLKTLQTYKHGEGDGC